MTRLPVPEAAALAHSQSLLAAICGEVQSGWRLAAFARFMELVLYAPGQGYYTAGTRKFGAAGDFVTAPK